VDECVLSRSVSEPDWASSSLLAPTARRESREPREEVDAVSECPEERVGAGELRRDRTTILSIT
jgi:hypothetical protein